MNPTAIIDRDGFKREETFASRDDAAHWKRMVEVMLLHKDRARFDMQVFAAGLAESVREHGGARVKKALLAGTADPHDWMRGRPLATKSDLEARMLAVLRGK